MKLKKLTGKWALSAIIAASMVMGSLPLTAIPVSATEISGSYNISWNSGAFPFYSGDIIKQGTTLTMDEINYSIFIDGQEVQSGNTWYEAEPEVWVASRDYLVVETDYKAYLRLSTQTQADQDYTVSVAGWKYDKYDADANKPVLEGTYDANGTQTITYYTAFDPADASNNVLTNTENSGAASEGGVPTIPGTYYCKVDIAESNSYTAGSAYTSFTIEKGIPEVTLKTKTLFYTGAILDLLQSNEITPAEGGEIKYSVNQDGNTTFNELKPDQKPQAVKVGVYNVYYRVKNTDDAYYINQDFDLSRYVSVEIKAAPTVTMEDYTYGKDLPDPVVSDYPDDTTFWYYSADKTAADAVEWDDTITSLKLDVGDYCMFAVISETDDHVGFTTEPVEFTVEVNETTEPDITLDPESYTYDGNECKPSVVVKDGENVIPAAEYTVDYSENVEPGEGTATVTITDNEGGNYTVSGTKTFDIDKATITPVVSMSDYTWGEEPSEPSVTGNTEDGDVTYFYNKTGVISDEDQEWTGEEVDAGTYYIYAKVAETDHYLAATSEVQEFVVDQKTLTVEVTLDDWTYGDTAATPEITGNEESDGEVTYEYFTDAACTIKTVAGAEGDGADVDGGMPTLGGTYYVKATVAETTNYYEVSDIDEFTIEKKDPVFGEDFNVVKNNLTYNGSEQELLTVTSVEGLVVKLTYSEFFINILDGIPKETTAGTYMVYYHVQENRNYNEYEWAGPLTIKIAEADPILTAPEAVELTYDRNAHDLVTEGVLDPKVDGENAGIFTYALGLDDQTAPSADKFSETIPQGTNAGTYYVWYQVTDGNSNYLAVEPTCVEVTIAQKEVKVSDIKANDKTYDGTTDASFTVTDVIFDGIIEGDTLAVGVVGSFADENAEVAKIVTIETITLGGTSKDNYVLADDGQQETAEATINKLGVTVSGITAEDKIYDGTTEATLVFDEEAVVFTGLLEGDSLTVSGTGTFADANVGDDKEVTISDLALGGDSAGNYKLATEGQQDTTTASISQKEVIVSGIEADDKTYDGTTDATFTVTNAVFDGIEDGDTLSVEVTGSFADKNVEDDKEVTIESITLIGDSKDNYVLAEEGHQASSTAAITAKTVTVADGVTAEDKQYDGTDEATVICDAANLDGFVEGDDLVVTATGTFSDINIGNDLTVTIFDYALDGEDKDNYELSDVGNQEVTTADITKRDITISVKDQTIFVGEDIVSGPEQVDVEGIVDGESITGITLSPKYNSEMASFGTINVSDVTITNSNSVDTTDNYKLNYIAGLVTVVQKGVVVSEPPYATPITYGQTLSDSTFTGGVVKYDNVVVEGAFAWAEGQVAPTVADSGKTQYAVTFTPTDSATYEPTTFAMTVVVNKADPEVEVPTGLTATYGDTLADVTITQPDGGVWSFVDDDTTEVGVVGTQEFEVVYTPDDEFNYNSITGKTVSIAVAQADPEYTVPTGLTATYGDTLGDVTIEQPENGTWTFTDETASVGNAGTNVFTATFTPSDDNYKVVENVEVEIAVEKADLEVEAPTGLTATYGDTLGDVTIEQPENGTWTFTDATASVGNVGTNTFTATFTPSNDNYNVVENVEVKVKVGKADLEYVVPTGLTATYGDTLADVTIAQPENGKWTFADATASVGNAGTNTFKATFTPNDSANYNAVTNVEVKVTVAKADPKVTAPTGLTATYGQTLADVKIAQPKDGTWTFADTKTSVGNAGTNTFKATFTPSDTKNYNTVANVDVKITVAKADAAVKKAPTANTLKANGKAQALVTAGESTNGTMQYAIGKDANTAPTSGYSATIPTGTAAGTYYVWYKVVGNANYNDTKAACVTVTVEKETGVAGFVERLYTIALDRDSDPSGKEYWVDQVKTKGKTGADIAKGFLFSEEFLNNNANNSDFVETLYETFFDRASEPEGKAFWVNALEKGTMSKQDVINGFINSNEWANVCLTYGIPSGGTGKATITVEPNEDVLAFATRLYTTCLGRDPEADGLKYWSTELANMKKSGTEAAYGFFFSEEFVGHNYSNEEYVKRLYRTFMGREYEQEGFDYWVGRLNSGATREEVFYGFANSAEFTEICASYGIIR